MSVHALSWVLRQSEARGACRLVLISIADHADSQGRNAWPSVDTMRRDARLKSRRSVQNALRDLVSQDSIRKTGESRAGTSVWAIVGMEGGAKNAPGAKEDLGGAQKTTGGGANPAPEPSKEPSTKQPSKDEADQVRVIFDFWVSSTGRDPKKTKLTDDRRRAVRARLDEGYTAERICRAIEGCASDPWNRGENERGRRYDDLTLICRTGAKLEDFESRPIGEAPARSPLPDDVELTDRALTAWASVTESMKKSLGAATWTLWVEPLRVLGESDDKLYVRAPSGIRTWTERRYLKLMNTLVEAHGFDDLVLDDDESEGP